ncbi:MAG TPA: FG-GAP-like repeat-containing protein [Opitutaceae bacterium]|nr:FG-GAP-like repeat-containing protein [Opitutaceae bacterium]
MHFGSLLLIASVLLPLSIRAEQLEGKPFAPRSGPRGATLFTTMPAAETGLVAMNPYDDPRMWGPRYREFNLGAIGYGIAIGDYDNDGLPDIFVVNKTGENHLFRNLGHFKFEDVTAKTGVGGPIGEWKDGATFADINNDGRLDLYVCRFAAPNLLYVNQGDGTFKEEAVARGLNVVDASGQAAFADYDRDGFLDVYVQTNVLDGEAHPNGQRDYLFHNNGDGTFTNVTDRAGISGETQGHSAIWWDYNEDGWPDVYIANDFKDADVLYRNNGDGTFSNVLSWVLPHTPESSMGADLGDVDNNGHIDFLVADMAATTRYKDQRGMAKLRAGMPESDSKPNAAQQYMHNALYLNFGTNRMMEAAYLTGLAATDWTWAVRLEDLDNDGRLDAFFSNGMVRELHSADLLKAALPVENLTERTLIMKASPRLDERNLVYRNLGDLHFENVSQTWGLDHLGVKFACAFGDLDGDGDLDVVFGNYEGNITVCRNDLDTGHSIVFDLRGHLSNRFGIGSIVKIETSEGRQIRPLLLARGYMASSEPMVHFGLGKSEKVDRVTIEWPSGVVQTLENLAADRRYTIEEPQVAKPTLTPPPEHDAAPQGQFSDITAAANLAIVSKEKVFNELKAQPLLSLRQNRAGPAAAVTDIDGDGEEDLAIGGTYGEPGRYFSNLGGGNFLPYGSGTFSDPAQLADGPILFLDANGDGKDDLLVTRGGDAKPAGHAAYQPRLFLNDGAGHFSAAAESALPTLSISVGAACTADFDRDGKLDLFLGARLIPGQYPRTPRSALLQNLNGKFVDMTDTVAPALREIGMVTSALWSDVDGDGWLDLVLTLDWGGIKYFHSEAGKSFSDQSDAAGFSAAGTGWWSSLAAADFNGDGRPDFVVGNVGLNTRYTASPDHPALIFSGVFDSSGRTQLIDAQYEANKLYPIRGLLDLAQPMPFLLKKFPTFDSYAKATLEEVFPAEQLAKAARYAATNFQSGILLSDASGKYRFAPLPRIAQIAPIFGMVAGDFDGDGHLDLAFVQNSFAPIPESSRFDGGLGGILRGDGRGGFTFVSPKETGFMVIGDAKALLALDYDGDGWADFFITRDNDRTLALKNKGRPGQNSFHVALKGPPGNPHAIGARISVALSDGATETAEVTGGSSYRSQSSAALFFGYPANNLPKTITVRWPDGRTSTHPWTTPTRKLVLTQPVP